jgi:hypothetical protein
MREIIKPKGNIYIWFFFVSQPEAWFQSKQSRNVPDMTATF